jgi:hypothetical protein
VDATVAAAHPTIRQAEKAEARDAYQSALDAATTDAARMEAAAAWAETIDRINRQGRLSARALTKARGRLAAAEAELQAAQRTEQTLRFRAEAAQAACLEGRVRMAACEERLGEPAPERDAGSEPAQPAPAHVGRLGEVGGAQPLVIEAILAGDARAIEDVSVIIAERAVLSPAEVRLQLRELLDAIVMVAAEEGYLVFDDRYPLWAQLTLQESRDVVRALARLGFRLEPREGWHAGRAPSHADLTMALGYAGLDTRNLRALPSGPDLASMPASIGVDTRACLAARAPELAVDQLVRLLGDRSSALEPLWDAWGQVRHLLFSERRRLEVGEPAVTG